MLCRQLLSQTLPFLRPTDSVFQALNVMADHQVLHLPMVEGAEYVGLVSESSLHSVDDDQTLLQQWPALWQAISVKAEDHLLMAVQLAAEQQLTVIPVITPEKELIGTLLPADLIRAMAAFLRLEEPGGLLVLEMEPRQYAFSEMSRLVETHDAQITQLNTRISPDTGQLIVTIRLNKPEVSDIVATFQRYEYNVVCFFGEELYTNQLRSNFDNLMTYLNV
ncbi:MAG: CBS domain-containing protein [Bacteroidota bacterium]